MTDKLNRVLLGVVFLLSCIANAAGLQMPTVTSELTTEGTAEMRATTVSLGTVHLGVFTSEPRSSIESSSPQGQQSSSAHARPIEFERQIAYWYVVLREVVKKEQALMIVNQARQMKKAMVRFRETLNKHISEKRVPPGFDDAFTEYVIGKIKQLDQELHKCFRVTENARFDQSVDERDKRRAKEDKTSELLRKSQGLKTYVRQCTNRNVPSDYVPGGVRPVTMSKEGIKQMLKNQNIYVDRDHTLSTKFLDRLVSYLNTGLSESANQSANEQQYRAQVKTLEQLISVIAGNFSTLYANTAPGGILRIANYETDKQLFFMKWFMDLLGPVKVPFMLSGTGPETWISRMIKEANTVIGTWTEYAERVSSGEITLTVTQRVLESYLGI